MAKLLTTLPDGSVREATEAEAAAFYAAFPAMTVESEVASSDSVDEAAQVEESKEPESRPEEKPAATEPPKTRQRRTKKADEAKEPASE